MTVKEIRKELENIGYALNGTDGQFSIIDKFNSTEVEDYEMSIEDVEEWIADYKRNAKSKRFEKSPLAGFSHTKIRVTPFGSYFIMNEHTKCQVCGRSLDDDPASLEIKYADGVYRVDLCGNCADKFMIMVDEKLPE